MVKASGSACSPNADPSSGTRIVRYIAVSFQFMRNEQLHNNPLPRQLVFSLAALYCPPTRTRETIHSQRGEDLFTRAGWFAIVLVA
jgi:hypothetical protein